MRSHRLEIDIQPQIYTLTHAHYDVRNFVAPHHHMSTASARRIPTRQHPAPKRPTNLSLSVDVLEAAKALNFNVSQVCDNHLRQLVAQEQEKRWRTEHADFVAAYNATLETEGLPLEQWRTF